MTQYSQIRATHRPDRLQGDDVCGMPQAMAVLAGLLTALAVVVGLVYSILSRR